MKNSDTKLLIKLNEWRKNKDYSVVSSWTADELLDQIEERLDLLEHACLNRGAIDNQIRWKMLEKNDLFLKGHISKRAINPLKSELCEPLSRGALTSLGLTEVSSTTGLNDGFRNDYAFDIHDGEIGVALFIPISTSTDEMILKDLAHALPQLRRKLSIKEPTSPVRKPAAGAIKSFLNYRTIEYLDIAVFLVRTFKSERRVSKPSVIAEALNSQAFNNKELLGGNDISKWEANFYNKKLFKDGWFKSTATNIRSELP